MNSSLIKAGLPNRQSGRLPRGPRPRGPPQHPPVHCQLFLGLGWNADWCYRRTLRRVLHHHSSSFNLVSHFDDSVLLKYKPADAQRSSANSNINITALQDRPAAPGGAHTGGGGCGRTIGARQQRFAPAAPHRVICPGLWASIYSFLYMLCVKTWTGMFECWSTFPLHRTTKTKTVCRSSSIGSTLL